LNYLSYTKDLNEIKLREQQKSLMAQKRF
jgi:hypothetical protein